MMHCFPSRHLYRIVYPLLVSICLSGWAASALAADSDRNVERSDAQAATPEDWPRWRGPRGDGTWNGPPLPEEWPAEGLKTVWKQPLGGGYAGVTVADGRAYTMDRQTEPEEVERILCFAAEDGELLWSHSYGVKYGDLDYGNGPRAAPTIADGRVYALGALGRLYCLDAAGGRVEWSADLVRDYGGRVPTWGYAASPLIFENLVIVMPGGSEGKSVVALDRRTGKEVWRSLDDGAGYATPMVIRHRDHRQLICWTPTNIRSLDPAKGDLYWTVPYEITYGVAISTPIFEQNIVLVCGYWEGSKAVRLGEQPTDAELIWEENRYLRGVMSQPLYRDGHVYLLDKQYGLTRFELATGKKLWDDKNQLTPRNRNPQASLVWIDGKDRIIALNAEGELILAKIDPAGYQEQSRTKIIGHTWAHPAFAGRYVYARDDNEIVCVELPTVER